MARENEGAAWEVAHQWPRHPRSVGRSRAALRLKLTAWGVAGDPADVAELLLSELMTNAYRHARKPSGREIGTFFALQGSRLRIEVADACDDQPVPRPVTDEQETGRGLLLVRTMAHRWGVCPRPHGIGKVVWVELHGVERRRSPMDRPHS